MAKLDLQYRELSVDPLTPSSSKVSSEMGDGPQLEEVQSSADDMDLTNRLGDPHEPPAACPNQGVSLHPLRLRRLCRTDDASKRCRVVASFSHDSVLKASENGQLSRQDGAQHISGLCSLYGLAVRATSVPLESESSEYLDH